MRTAFLLLFISTLLVACEGQPFKPVPTVEYQPLPAEQIQDYLARAKTSPSPKRELLQLKAADILLEENQPDIVEDILDNMDIKSLPLNVYARHAEISVKLQILRGDYTLASQIIDAPRLQSNLESLPEKLQIRLSLLRAEVFALLGNHIASAQQRIYINPLLTTENQASNRDAIWASLMQVTQQELSHYLSSSFQGEYQGWLLLALIAKENQGDLDQQLKQLAVWQQQWPAHPANLELPGGLQLIQELAASRPQQIALLLPLTGQLGTLGKAVRDGFIAAMYETKAQGSLVPTVKVYNTADHEDFRSLYQQAINEGAEMVVGPLEKRHLSQLFDQLSLPVPTLGLNRIDNYGPSPDQLFQFGLAPQDEAKQLADIAFLDNRRQALIIAPVGEWGDKVTDAFNTRWNELGGTTIAMSRYSGQKDYSSSIKDSLLLKLSEDRASRIQRVIGERIEFSPRRRDDIDMVLLLARPQHARSIKPLLAFHYAGNLPVYGTSRLYAGYENTVKDRDLNGVRFTDMPWILEKPTELHQQISKEIAQSAPYQRMYALGVDSYQLHPRLRQLQEIPNSRVYGNTGTLKLNEQKIIERDMLLAQIVSSKAKLIPIASHTIDLNLSTTDGENDDKTMEQQSQ